MRTSSEWKASPLGCGWFVISCGMGLDGKLSTISSTTAADSIASEEAPKEMRLDLCLTNGCSSTSSTSSWTDEFPSPTITWLDACILGKLNPCLHEETNHLLETCTMHICNAIYPIPDRQYTTSCERPHINGSEPKSQLFGFIPTF